MIWKKLQKVKNRSLRTVTGAHKATPLQSLQADVGILPLPLHMDCRQACFCLRSAESVIKKIITKSITKVRQFLGYPKTYP
jgi:hypothetical protein